MVISRVIKGEKKAREIGFKTANFKINDYCNFTLRSLFCKCDYFRFRIDNKLKESLIMV